MTSLGHIKDSLGLGASEFMSEWKSLTNEERSALKDAARAEAIILGISLEDAQIT